MKRFKFVLLLFILMMSTCCYACQHSPRTFYYFYFAENNLVLNVGDSISLSSLSFDTNVDLDNVYLTCDLDILQIQGQSILAKEAGDCHIAVCENVSNTCLTILEVRVYSADENNIDYILQKDVVVDMDIYTLSFFMADEPLIEFTYDEPTCVLSISKMANSLYISCEKDLSFSITIRTGNSYLVIPIP